MILSTMADRFEAFYLSNVPLMTPRPTHLDLMKAFYAGACEFASLLAVVHESDETIDEKAAAQDRLLDETFAFAQRMFSEGFTQLSDEGANDVQPQ